MQLPYLDKVIESPDGAEARVLDEANVDFSSSVEGRKATETLVKRAQGGEQIETKNSDGQVESVYTARPNDAIFQNIHNPDDVYVPGNPDGSRWKFDELEEKGYEITGKVEGGVTVKSAAMSQLLVEAIEGPTCIENAWGEGAHQFLYDGATLKLNDNGAVTGIDKEAFDATWEYEGQPAKAPDVCHDATNEYDNS